MQEGIVVFATGNQGGGARFRHAKQDDYDEAHKKLEQTCGNIQMCRFPHGAAHVRHTLGGERCRHRGHPKTDGTRVH